MRRGRLTSRLLSLACAAVAGLVVGGPALVALSSAALPANVIALHGSSSQHYDVIFTYAVNSRSINGFSVDYTCRGKPLKADQDLFTISDGGSDDKALSKVRSHGVVSFTLKGAVTRFSEDGPFPQGSGKLVVRAKLSSSAGKQVLKGTVRVLSSKCPSSKRLTFRSAGRLPQA